jgi:hypothetical protein
VNGLPYRKGKPDGFRRIHIELAQAVRSGRRIELIILENPPLADINRRERELIAERGSLNAGGTWPRGLNSSSMTGAASLLSLLCL